MPTQRECRVWGQAEGTETEVCVCVCIDECIILCLYDLNLDTSQMITECLTSPTSWMEPHKSRCGWWENIIVYSGRDCHKNTLHRTHSMAILGHDVCVSLKINNHLTCRVYVCVAVKCFFSGLPQRKYSPSFPDPFWVSNQQVWTGQGIKLKYTCVHDDALKCVFESFRGVVGGLAGGCWSCVCVRVWIRLIFLNGGEVEEASGLKRCRMSSSRISLINFRF